MADKAKEIRDARLRRHVRIRRKVQGTPERPRLCVFRSNKFIYAQVIDDTKHAVLAASGKMVILITHDKLSLSYCNKIISLDEQ